MIRIDQMHNVGTVALRVGRRPNAAATAVSGRPRVVANAQSPQVGLIGLSSAEAEARRRQGLGNEVPMQSSRSYWQILRENVFSFINVVLFMLGIAVVVLGRPADALVSVGVVVVNVVVAVLQEVRAKRKLDRIALLTRATATVLRDGQERHVDPGQVVLGDVLVVRPGDQVVADGRVVGSAWVDVDESLLTGESDVVPKSVGEVLYSGSFCVHGSATYEAEQVGMHSMASQLTVSARAFRRVATPLQTYITIVVRVLLLAALFFEMLLIGATLIYGTPMLTHVENSVVVLGLVPQGLFLSIAVAYALGAARIAGKSVLVQQSNAIESLSNVDVLCLDKTGTLTSNHIRLQGTLAIGVSDEELLRLLGDFGQSITAANHTSEALSEACPGRQRNVIDEVPFASERKWSGLTIEDPALAGTFVLGAPEILKPYMMPGERRLRSGRAADSAGHEADSAGHEAGDWAGEALSRDADIDEWQDPAREHDPISSEPENWARVAEAWADQGLRVILFARAAAGEGDSPLRDEHGRPCLPSRLVPLGLVSFSDELRVDAAQTLARFARAGIKIKIISGDNPHTVAALARQAGLGPEIRTMSGQKLAAMDEEQFAAAAESANVFGRITPEQKAGLVQALKKRGHYVAMTGDGINDVLALKQAHLGIAMETGSQAPRAIADMVLLGDSFAALPAAFEEGQRIRNGMQDVLKLFLTRLLVVTLLVGAVGFVGGFAFTPKQVSLVGFLTIGIPTIVLAARAGVGTAGMRSRVMDVIRFVVPAALSLVAVSLTVYLALLYAHSRWLPVGAGPSLPSAALDAAVPAAQSGLATILVLCGLMLIPFVVPPTPAWQRGGASASELAAGPLFVDWRPTGVAFILLVVYGLILATPGLRSFFELARLSAPEYGLIACLTLIWALLMRWAWRSQVLERYLYGHAPEM